MARKILVQVTAPTIAIGLVLLAACLISAWYINRLQSNLANILQNHVASLRAAQEMEIRVRQLRFHCFQYLIGPNDDLESLIADDEAQFESWLGTATALAQTRKEVEFVRQIKEGYDRYRREFDRLSSEVTPDNPRRDFQVIAEGNPVKHIVEPCRGFFEENQNTMDVTAEETRKLSKNLGLVMLFLGVIGPLGGLLSGYGIARGLTRTLYQLSVRVQDMANQFDHDVASVRVTPGGDPHKQDDILADVVHRVEEVTQRVQKQQRELLRAEQLATVGKLAACVAHEIRNPLAAIKLLVSIALRPRNPKPLTDEDLRVIHDETGRLEQTVQNLLDFAKLPSPQRTSCDLREVVQRALDLIRARAGLQDVEIAFHCVPNAVTAAVDRGQWRNLLVNLFLNALDAMPNGGRLEIDLDCPSPEEIRLRVTDSGAGILPDRKEDLFTPFVSSKPSGTGLGLTISRRVVEEHGGRITAANRPEDKGTGACFTILLPVNSRTLRHAEASNH